MSVSTVKSAQRRRRKVIAPAEWGRSAAECLDSTLHKVLRACQISGWIAQYNGWVAQINVWSLQINS